MLTSADFRSGMVVYRRYTVRVTVIIWVFIGVAACKPVQRTKPRRVKFDIEGRLPAECIPPIRTYIDSQQMRARPKDAVAAFRKMAEKYTYPKDSLAHAIMRCYEGQAWDVLHQGDSMLRCYDDATTYLQVHPELLDMRIMSDLFSGWAHYYKSNRLTANYYFSRAGNELEDTVYLRDGTEYLTSGYSRPARVALLAEIAGNVRVAGLREQAKHYIQRALYTIGDQHDSMPDLYAFSLLEAGVIYAAAKQTDSAQTYLHRAVPIILQLHDTLLLLTYYDHKGSIFLAAGQYDSSLAAYRTAMALQTVAGADSFERAQVAEGLAASYMGLRRYPETEQALAIARPVFYDDTTMLVSERAAFSRTYLRYLLHDTKAAPVFERFLTQSDSVFDEQRLHAISDMDAQYGLQKKEAHISRLDKENQGFLARVATQQAMLVGSILIITLLAVLIAFLRQLQRRRRLEGERDKAVLEQQLLRSQMEPHFIFNTLSVLQSLIRKNEKELSVKYLSQFARLLRISLENAREAFVPLSEEVEALQHYLSLQQVRFQNAFTYVIDTYDAYEEEAEGLLIPPMLLQPFVENAIQHGVAGMKNEEGRVSIRIRREEKSLTCIIEDNGTGSGQAGSKDVIKKNSLSTTITRERLALLSRQSGTPASVDIRWRRQEGSGDGVLVQLVIPFVEG